MIVFGLCAFIGIGKFKFTGSLEEYGAATIAVVLDFFAKKQ